MNFSHNRMAFVLAVLLAGVPDTASATKFQVPFATQDWPPPRNMYCYVDIAIDGKPAGRNYGMLPGFEIDLPDDLSRDVRIEWQGQLIQQGGPRRNFSCSERGSIWLSELYAIDWKQFESAPERWSAEYVACVRFGMTSRGMPYQTARDPQRNPPYPSVVHPIAKEVFGICQDLLVPPLVKSEACTLPGGVKSTCAQVHTATRNGSVVALSTLDALKARLAGEEVTRRSLELMSAKKEREARAAEAERQAAAARAEEAKRQAWLQTAEGRKYTADQQAKRAAEEAAAAKKAAEDRARLLRDYPYYAVLTCGMDGHISMFPCLQDDEIRTEIELRNGEEYDLYKTFHVANGRPGSEQREGYVIDLRRSFALKVQNASNSLTLGVKIVDRATGRVTFQKKVGLFGVIAVEN